MTLPNTVLCHAPKVSIYSIQAACSIEISVSNYTSKGKDEVAVERWMLKKMNVNWWIKTRNSNKYIKTVELFQ
jgi:hypothetical protein